MDEARLKECENWAESVDHPGPVIELVEEIRDLREALEDYRGKAHALSTAILGPGARLHWYQEALIEAKRLREALESKDERIPN